MRNEESKYCLSAGGGDYVNLHKAGQIIMVNGQWYDIYGTIKSRGLLKAKLRPILMINRDTKEGLVRKD